MDSYTRSRRLTLPRFELTSALALVFTFIVNKMYGKMTSELRKMTFNLVKGVILLKEV
jgi:hypothetical protein